MKRKSSNEHYTKEVMEGQEMGNSDMEDSHWSDRHMLNGSKDKVPGSPTPPPTPSASPLRTHHESDTPPPTPQQSNSPNRSPPQTPPVISPQNSFIGQVQSPQSENSSSHTPPGSPLSPPRTPTHSLRSAESTGFFSDDATTLTPPATPNHAPIERLPSQLQESQDTPEPYPQERQHEETENYLQSSQNEQKSIEQEEYYEATENHHPPPRTPHRLNQIVNSEKNARNET
jgi:hypothetical protein